MCEDLGDHCGILVITAGSSITAMIFRGPPHEEAVFNIDIEYPFEQAGPADAGRTGPIRHAQWIIRDIIGVF